MKPFRQLIDRFSGRSATRRSARRRIQSAAAGTESMEARLVMTANPLPVLMVIADSRDFYYQEYGDTRIGIENEGVSVQVAAATLTPSVPHFGTGQGADGGIVVPDVTLANVNVDDYSAILFVGGWGSSMYQYAFSGDYADDHYDGDPATKELVNNLIGEFLDQDKFVTAICHGVTVLAWARVDGVSPLQGRQVSVPYIGSPAVEYNGVSYGNFQLGQYEQVVANGAIANTVSMQYGDPYTVTDDVVRDGRIITAENYDAAASFGTFVGEAIMAEAEAEVPPVVNQPPVISDDSFSIDENSVAGTVVGTVNATDPDAGQSVSFSIVSGNTGGAFAIDAATGQITVASMAMLNFELTPVFQLVISATDNGAPALEDLAAVTINLQDVAESLTNGVHQVGNDLVVQGSSGVDQIYIWSGSLASDVMVWMNGVFYGNRSMPAGSRVIVQGAEGNDRIFATDLRRSVIVHGGSGHDLITGGSAADELYGDAGVDRLSGLGGADLIFGGDDQDYLYGGEGDDILIGGDGNDYLEGFTGRDMLIGGSGSDYMKAGDGDDLLIGGITSYDNQGAALRELQSVWTGGGTALARAGQIGQSSGQRAFLRAGQTVFSDNFTDILCGGTGTDLIFTPIGDSVYSDIDDLFSTFS
ncbi:MAG: cadherin domain-containing protein [Planctomyces sp.]